MDKKTKKQASIDTYSRLDINHFMYFFGQRSLFLFVCTYRKDMHTKIF